MTNVQINSTLTAAIKAAALYGSNYAVGSLACSRLDLTNSKLIALRDRLASIFDEVIQDEFAAELKAERGQ